MNRLLRRRDHARDMAVARLRYDVEIALYRAANGQPIRRPLGRLTINRMAEIAAERGYELRLDLRPIEDAERTTCACDLRAPGLGPDPTCPTHAEQGDGR